MKIYIFLILLFFAGNAKEQLSKNIWLKSYQNYKNYNIIINNISKLEQKIQSNKKNPSSNTPLYNKLSLYKSKLELYGNNNFNTILRNYNYTVSTISLRDFLLNTSEEDLDRLIEKFIIVKNDFYLAKSTIQQAYTSAYSNNPQSPKIQGLKDDLEYFIEYTENIEKTYQNLLESKDELNKKYQEYKDETFIKHLLTLAIIFVLYISYRLFAVVLFYFTNNKEHYETSKNYRKLLALLFVLTIILFIIIRYIEDFIYIITFLSVVAAALTLAMREVLLNIAGAIYIFFSSIVKVGDRVMIQFETKHTIGDISDISLIKIKLNEIEDYSNIKEIKTVGRTIYIPNSYIFTKVFYNYSIKKNGIIHDLIEFEFSTNSDFSIIEQVTNAIFIAKNISYTISFNLNSLKTAMIAMISYETNYKESTKLRGKISIELLKAFQENEFIKLKSTKASSSKTLKEEV